MVAESRMPGNFRRQTRSESARELDEAKGTTGRCECCGTFTLLVPAFGIIDREIECCKTCLGISMHLIPEPKYAEQRCDTPASDAERTLHWLRKSAEEVRRRRKRDRRGR